MPESPVSGMQLPSPVSSASIAPGDAHPDTPSGECGWDVQAVTQVLDQALLEELRQVDPSARCTLSRALLLVTSRARRPLSLAEYVTCVDPLVAVTPTASEVRVCLLVLGISARGAGW